MNFSNILYFTEMHMFNSQITAYSMPQNTCHSAAAAC